MKSAPILAMAACLAAIAVSGCSSEQPSGKATAGGEILEGSASDAMLPLDTVRSQPPLAPRATESGKAADSASPDAASSEAADPAEAAAKPTEGGEAPKPAAE